MSLQGGFRNPLVTSATIADGAITSIKLASTLQSDNFVTGVSGWRIRRDTGSAEFQDVTARGTIHAAAGTIDGTLTMGAGGRIQFQRNSSAVISTNHSPQNGDVWIEYRGNSAGAIIGQWRSGGVDLVTAQLNVTNNGFEVAAGQILLNTFNTNAVPDLAFKNDTDTGLGRASTNAFDLITGGSRTAHIFSGGIVVGSVSTGDIRLETNGRYSFQGDTNTYFHRVGSDAVRIVAGGAERFRVQNSSAYVVISPPNGNGNVALQLAIERAWNILQRGSGASTHLEFRSTSNKQLFISDTSNGLIAQFGFNAVHMHGANTTTNSGLAAWRNNGFPGTEMLKLSSSQEDKTDIKDANPKPWLNRLDQLQPKTYRSKTNGDDGRRVFLGLVKEDAEKVWPDWTYEAMTVPLLMAIQDLRQRVKELENAA